MPIVDLGMARSLKEFLEKASLAVNDWHIMPGYGLAIRFLAPAKPRQTMVFEICESDSPLPVRRFYYDSRAHSISLPPAKPVEHPELTAHLKLPNNPDELARVIATLVNDDPAFLQNIERALTFDHRRVMPDEALDRQNSRVGPVNHAFSDILRHLTSHWFSGRQVEWRLPLRFTCALFGSVTLIFIQAVVYSAHFPEWFSQFTGITPRKSDYELFLSLTSQVGLALLLSVFFASLTSAIDQQHGPVRLFFGGFLVPFFVLSLVTWLNS